MEDNLHEWCLLEYYHMTTFIHPCNLYFTNLSMTAEASFKNSEILKETNFLTEKIINMNVPMDKICLLDPASSQVLEPKDGDAFEYFLFGGILGDDPPRGECFRIYVLSIVSIFIFFYDLSMIRSYI
jgi:ribosome biogenesis SPOUT family RNA methylase Rps3